MATLHTEPLSVSIQVRDLSQRADLLRLAPNQQVEDVEALCDFLATLTRATNKHHTMCFLLLIESYSDLPFFREPFADLIITVEPERAQAILHVLLVVLPLHPDLTSKA